MVGRQSGKYSWLKAKLKYKLDVWVDFIEENPCLVDFMNEIVHSFTKSRLGCKETIDRSVQIFIFGGTVTSTLVPSVGD